MQILSAIPVSLSSDILGITTTPYFRIGDPIQEYLYGAPVSLCILFRLLLTLLLSAIIGWERASKRHSAGLRTFTVVALASASAAIIDFYFLAGRQPLLSAAVIVAMALLSGNSVLFSSRSQIKGLTTSISLWGICVLGIACGSGLYVLALILFACLLVTLTCFTPLERYLKNRSNHFEIHLELKNSYSLQDFVATIRKLGLTIDDIELNPAYANSGLSVYSIAISIQSGELKKYKTHAEIIQALSTIEYVYHIEEMRN